jgi:drug/metabolite transporter (DMT)-like permease
MRVNPLPFDYDKADLLGLLAGTASFVMGDVSPETHRLIAVLPVAFLASVLLIFRIMQYVSSRLVGILMLSEVLVAALSSWLLLQEALTLSQWAGVLAILGTGVFVGLTEKAAES